MKNKDDDHEPSPKFQPRLGIPTRSRDRSGRRRVQGPSAFAEASTVAEAMADEKSKAQGPRSKVQGWGRCSGLVVWIRPGGTGCRLQGVCTRPRRYGRQHVCATWGGSFRTGTILMQSAKCRVRSWGFRAAVSGGSFRTGTSPTLPRKSYRLINGN